MTSKHKEIARREFLTTSTKNAAGIFALTNLVSCTSSEELPRDENPVIGDNENKQIVTSYEVDPTWPQKPEEFTWGGVPGVVVDEQDHVWIINRSQPVVQAYDTDGKLLTAWGKTGVEADSTMNKLDDLSFSTPTPLIHYIRIDYEGNVWIGGWRLQVVYKCSPEGKLLLTLGTLNEPGKDETHLNMPTDMAILSTGEVLVADEYNNQIAHFDPNGRFIKAWGREGTGPGEFVHPHAMAIDSKGLIYIADRGAIQGCRYLTRMASSLISGQTSSFPLI